MSNKSIDLEGFLIEAGSICIEDAVPLPNNPKNHLFSMIENLYGKFGFIRRVLIQRSNLHILAGNGRIEELLKEKAAGKSAPKGVVVTSEGKWAIPCDYIDLPLEEEMTVALADNRAEELGGWDNQKLSKALADVPKASVDLIGFEKELITALQSYYEEEENDPSEWDEEVAQAVAKASPTKGTTGTTSTGKKDLSVLKYVLRTDTVARFRKLVRQIMKEHEITDISDVFDHIVSEIGIKDDSS